MNRLLIILAFSSLCYFSFGQNANNTSTNIDSDELKNVKNDVYILASDSFKGREAGSEFQQMSIDYITKKFKAIGLKPYMGNDYLQSFAMPVKGADKPKTSYNIIGFIDNGAKTTVVVGAHYDHLGLGFPDFLAKNQPTVHNGADDNASGTAGLFQIATFLKKSNLKNNNYLIISFGAEEEGAIGSTTFVNSPLFEKANINYMICLDMLGGLNPETKKLFIYGTGTSPVFDSIFKSPVDNGFNLAKVSSGAGGSDNSSFYIKGIPVLFFNSGDNMMVYHTPKDKADLLNYAGEVQIIHYVESVITKLNQFGKLPFTKTSDMNQSRNPKRPSMGAKPDMTYQGGYKIEFVMEGRQADKAGIKAGDIIIQIGDDAVSGMDTYKKAMDKFNVGDSTKITVMRGDQKITVDITF